jgi:hypothetical protein
MENLNKFLVDNKLWDPKDVIGCYQEPSAKLFFDQTKSQESLSVIEYESLKKQN